MVRFCNERYSKRLRAAGALAGKTALVTGAGRGIGRSIALRLARDGARVAVHYGSSADAARQTVTEIAEAGGDAFAIRGRLGVPGDAEALWAAFDEHADGLDILVNNAGVLGGRVPFADVDEPAYDEVFAVNTKAPFFLAQKGLPRLRDGGRIVNISTRFTHGARVPELMAYAMSKAAVDSFTATLAKQLGPRGITVNAVGPGATNTDMNTARLATADRRAAVAALSPLNRVAQPDDIADIVTFLASDDGRWVTGQWIDALTRHRATAGPHGEPTDDHVSPLTCVSGRYSVVPGHRGGGDSRHGYRIPPALRRVLRPGGAGRRGDRSRSGVRPQARGSA